MKIVILSLRNIFDSYLARPHVWPRTTRTQQPYHPLRPDGGKRILTPDKQTPPPFHHPPQKRTTPPKKEEERKIITNNKWLYRYKYTTDYYGSPTNKAFNNPSTTHHNRDCPFEKKEKREIIINDTWLQGTNAPLTTKSCKKSHQP